MIEETNTQLETVDQLNEQIRQLQVKAKKVQEKEILVENEEAMVEMPLANVRLKIDKNGSDIDLVNITPAELLFLCAEHHSNAGGNPVVSCVPQNRTSRRDPRIERSRLANKYSKKKIMTIFPGTEPKMPNTFTRAMSIGVETGLPEEKFLEFVVEPIGRAGE